MTLKEFKETIEWFEKKGYTDFEVSMEGFSFKGKKSLVYPINKERPPVWETEKLKTSKADVLSSLASWEP